MQDKKHPKYYHYGYRYINKQGPEKDWQYALQAHRNQNGLHFDLRLAKPGNTHAYSWASRKPPLMAVDKPALARRTFDHSLDHMDFQGPLKTAKGEGTVKLLRRGKAKMHSIDDTGIHFILDSGERFRLVNISGKKYIIKREE